MGPLFRHSGGVYWGLSGGLTCSVQQFICLLEQILHFKGTWRSYQQRVLDKYDRYSQDRKIHIVAAPGSGKTTFFNSIIHDCIPLGERLITIEDAKELRPPHENTLQLYYSRGGQGKAKVDAQSLMEACLRLYPKRILLGEIRGAEAFTYLNLISSGHGGSIATLHANDPLNAIERLTLMVLMAGTTLTSDQVKSFVKQSVDIIVQLGRTETGGYGCSAIYFKAYEDFKNEKTHLSSVA